MQQGSIGSRGGEDGVAGRGQGRDRDGDWDISTCPHSKVESRSTADSNLLFLKGLGLFQNNLQHTTKPAVWHYICHYNSIPLARVNEPFTARAPRWTVMFSAFVIMNVPSSSQTSPWGFPEDLPGHPDQLARLAGGFLHVGITTALDCRKPDLGPHSEDGSPKKYHLYLLVSSHTHTHLQAHTYTHMYIHRTKANTGKAAPLLSQPSALLYLHYGWEHGDQKENFVPLR